MPRPTYYEIFQNLTTINALRNVTRRPMVEATIGNEKYKMLYDTGSCITCMSNETLQRIKNGKARVTYVSPSQREFTSANGGRMTSNGIYEITMTIEKRTVKYPFHVLPKLHEKFILGIDFISQNELQLCAKHQHFHWQDKCPLDHERNLSSTKDVTLLPGETQVCTLRIKNFNAEIDGHVLAEIRAPKRPWLQGAPTLTTPDITGKIKLEIFNASPVPRNITKGENLGWIEAVNADQIRSISNVPEIQAIKHHTTPPPSRKDVDFIKQNAKIEGPSEQQAKYRKLFYQHHTVFSKHQNDLGKCDLLQHEIHLKSKEPVYIKQFKIPEGHQQAVTSQVREWLKLGIIQTSRSRYNSPMFVVKKKDGLFRLVQDFRALNTQTYIDKYSMRDVTDCIHEIGRSGSTIFSTIDLTSGFWQMVLEPKSRPLTAFTVYGMGQFEFKTSPMGLLGCPASFQKVNGNGYQRYP